METELDGGDIYAALRHADKSEGVINPGDKVERFAFAASLFKYDEQSYEALKQLISDDGGVVKPVMALKKENGTVRVIDGWHRVLAAKELGIPCPAVFYRELSETQMENAALSMNLSGRKMKPKERREIALTLYELYGWGYGRISKAIGDNNKSNVQRWITRFKNQNSEECPSGENGMSAEIDKICAIFEKGLKRARALYDVTRFSGLDIDEANTDRLKEIAESLRKIIDGQPAE